MKNYNLKFKNIFFLNFAFCILHFAFLTLPSHATSFDVPEKLIYDLTWTGIKAGTASLEITNDGNKIRIISTARSAKWVSVFYTVDDRAESTLIKNENNPPSPPFSKGGKGRFSGESSFIGQPLNYRLKIREGRHKRDKETIFNHSTKKATYINYLEGERIDFDVPANIFDPLSGFYYLRTFNLEVGRSVFIDIFDSKKVWNVEIQVLKKERLELPTGVFDTILVKPLMKSEGIFCRKGDILIWLTDDKKRIPVKLQTKVVVGSVVATLVGGVY
ncbi:MAG: DUF3108 domain-containing protein [Nitrospirota bacterium]